MGKKPAGARRLTAAGADILRTLGIEIAFSREGRTGRRMIRVSTSAEEYRQHRQHRQHRQQRQQRWRWRARTPAQNNSPRPIPFAMTTINLVRPTLQSAQYGGCRRC